MSARVLAVVLALLALGVIIGLLRGRAIREKYASIWLVLAVVVVVLAAFPGLSVWLAQVMGVVVPSNLVFIGAIAVLFFITVQLSVEVGRLESETRRLAEESALLSLRVDALERDLRGDTTGPSAEQDPGPPSSLD